MSYQSQKLVEGFSTCFRQWGATTTHCSFLHGYGVKIRFIWQSNTLDHRNWTVDFGAFKRSKVLIDGLSPKAWLDYYLDHTVLIAKDDPHLEQFKQLDQLKVIQLRIVEAAGCEKFAQWIYEKFAQWTLNETDGRCKLIQVDVIEHENNSASYVG